MDINDMCVAPRIDLRLGYYSETTLFGVRGWGPVRLSQAGTEHPPASYVGYPGGEC